MVTSAVLRTAWFRFRATFGRRWGGYLASSSWSAWWAW